MVDGLNAAAAAALVAPTAAVGRTVDAMDALLTSPEYASGNRGTCDADRHGVDVRAAGEKLTTHQHDPPARPTSTTHNGPHPGGCSPRRAGGTRMPLGEAASHNASVQRGVAQLEAQEQQSGASSAAVNNTNDVAATQPAAGCADMHATQAAAAQPLAALFEAVGDAADGGVLHDNFSLSAKPGAQLVLGRSVPGQPSQAADVLLPHGVVGLSRKHASLPPPPP
jgi:hypothetical protein